jgi:hypothetical protein
MTAEAISSINKALPSMKPSFTSAGNKRRGALLLIVMLMLALFMAIGAFLLTITMRARAAAKALEAMQSANAANDTILRGALDAALMAAIRGATSGSNGTVITGTMTENILHDKYGSPMVATGSALSGTNTPVMTLSLTGLSPAVSAPSRLNGRLLTIKPRTPDADITTFRIFGATGTSGTTTCFLANTPTTVARRLPNAAFDVIINGREFTPTGVAGSPESYDAFFDASDMWLAQPTLDDLGQVADFNRLSFLGESGTSTPIRVGDNDVPNPQYPAVDNDNDGVLDGAWIPTTMPTAASPPTPFVLSERPSVDGGTIRFQVSYLILDLDGRININAAGIAARDPAGYAGATGVPANAPLGMGYGPADVDASLLFPATFPASGTFAQSGTAALTSLTGTVFAINSGTLDGLTAPLKWPTLLLGGSTVTDGTSSIPYQRRRPWGIGAINGRYGANAVPGEPADDSGFLQSTGSSSYSISVAGTNTVGDLQGRKQVYLDGTTLVYYSPSDPGALRDWINDPYEAQLDGIPSQDDAPFTVSEFERVLRAQDSDAAELPQRLAAGLGDLAQLSRATITTESWDTPGLTGQAAIQIEGELAGLNPPLSYSGSNAWISASGTTNPVSPDVAAGLRFNINRPVLSGTSTEALAQQQDYCKGLYTLAVFLGAPLDEKTAQWAANALDFRDTDAVMTRFQYDTNLSDGWQTTGTNVVWGIERPEIVIAGMNNDGEVTFVRPHWKSEIRYTTGTAATDLIDPTLAPSAPAATMGLDLTKLAGSSADSIWRLKPDAGASINGNSLTPADQFNNIQSGSSVRYTFSSANSVQLQRLADPSLAFNADTNPYVTISEVKKNQTVDLGSKHYHWPNRPFISQAELAFVPGSDGTGFLPGVIPTSSLVGGGTALSQLLLDATFVPSRFAGTGFQVTGTALSNLGLERLQPWQFSKWREPGRVNVNTIVSGPQESAVSYDDVVWTTLIGGTSISTLTTGTITNIPFAGKPRTRTAPAIPGRGNGPTVPARTGQKATAAQPAQSVGQLLSLDTGANKPLMQESFTDDRKNHPFFAHARAIRLANTATIRSNVFAIWITVKMQDDSPNAPPPSTKRLFAIVDRSIPVGYSPGQDLNVRDCIRFVRYLD